MYYSGYDKLYTEGPLVKAELISISELLADFGMFTPMRSFGPKRLLDFLRWSFITPVFDPILVQDDRWVLDGQKRLHALQTVFHSCPSSYGFDSCLSTLVYRNSKAKNTVIPLVKLVDYILEKPEIHKIAYTTGILSPAQKGTWSQGLSSHQEQWIERLEYLNRYCVEWAQMPVVPLYTIQHIFSSYEETLENTLISESSRTHSPFSDIYKRSFPPPPVPLWSKIKRKGITQNGCTCSDPVSLNKQAIDRGPFFNPFIQAASSKIRTRHSGFFDLEEIRSDVYIVSQEIVDLFTWEPSRILEQLERLSERCKSAVINGNLTGKQIIKDAVDACNTLNNCKEKLSREKDDYCIKGFRKMQTRIGSLQSTILSSADCKNQDIPEISVSFSGCFLSHSIQLFGYTFAPGVYISNEENWTGYEPEGIEGSYSNQQLIPEEDILSYVNPEVLFHELTHAYLHRKKKKGIDCPWIEEGLAELCGKLLAKNCDTLAPQLYGAFRAKTTLYYNFLQELTKMRPAEIIHPKIREKL